MPLIHVTLLNGRSPQEVASLGRALTAAVHETLGRSVAERRSANS